MNAKTFRLFIILLISAASILLPQQAKAQSAQVVNAAKESAVAVKAMYDAFIEQGFNEAQAYELTVVMLKKQ